uniref:Rhodanese_C domain-containing protein n=1 Tax=Macrostomum lignano TaxID=282301 RepID=A0A1I8I3L1_9PLAT
KSFAQQQPQMPSSSSSAQPSAQAIGSSRFLSLGLQLHDNHNSASPAGSSNGADFLLPPAASPFWSDAASPTRQPLTNGAVGGLRSPSSVAGFGGGGGYSSCCHCQASCSTQSVCPSCRQRVCPDCVGSGRHSSLCSGPVGATSSRLVPLAAAAAAAAASSPTPPSAAGPGSPSAGASKRPLLPPWSRQVGGAGQPA